MQHLRLIQVPDGSPPYDGDVVDSAIPAAVRPAPAATPPDSADTSGTAWTRQFAQAIIETVAGTRPFRQIIPATTERVQAQIRGLIQLLRTDGIPRIQRVLASPVTPDVVEVTVIAAFGPRTRALAMRFEHLAARQSAPGLLPRPARWLCTDLETP